ncbi:hypothetical protein [Lactobacillus jensenii]|uniref:hypothetical protein n=1 Tax=Lactobacillus jensenii TaxID=109790 RepID=UPI001646363A|nr:hypothetical protein [Lactobacillus jensenii]MDK7308800.1 hypothetical protein [Lactobacillus jensenii]
MLIDSIADEVLETPKSKEEKVQEIENRKKKLKNKYLNAKRKLDIQERSLQD